MSDPYSFDNEDTDSFDPIDFVKAQQRATVAHVLSSLNDSPDEAIRAQEIGKDLQIPPIVVHGDMENYEQQHKAAITADLLKNNEFLRQYAASNPMAAKVSNDDWGNLDDVSSSLTTLGRAIGVPYPGTAQHSVVSKFIEGYKRGEGEGPVGSWVTQAPGGLEFAARYPFSALAYKLLGAPIEVPARLFSGIVQGSLDAITEGYVQAGGSEQEGRRLATALVGAAEHHMISGGMGIKPEVSPSAIDMIQARQLMSYISRGEPPPTGISPIYDALKLEEAKNNIKALKEVEKKVDASNTTQRDPEAAAGFIRQQTGDATIGVDASAIRQLYGSKVPELDDGLFGFLPNFEERLRLAEATGGDIELPLADWLARVPSEVKNELHDFTRIQPDAVNIEEGKFFKEHEQAVKDRPQPLASGEDRVDALRSAAALEPTFDPMRQQKLTLEKQIKEPDEFEPRQLAEGDLHEFAIKNAEGDKVGDLHIIEQAGRKNLYVEWIGAGPQIGPKAFPKTVATPGFLGPRVIRDLITQIKNEFPNAEKIGGFRVSGARAQASASGPMSLSLKSPAALTHDELGRFSDQLREIFRQAMEPELRTERIEGVDVTYKPTELYTQHEQQIIAEVGRLVDRIAPDVKQVVGTDITDVEGREKPLRAKGLYAGAKSTSDRLPIIFMALDEKGEMAASARHEAMHHLIDSGFITPAEFKVLKDAAERNRWAERFGIGKGATKSIAERYKDIKDSDIIHEAIAEAYAKWGKDAKMIDSSVHPIFQKIKDLLDEIKAIIKRITGTERAADIFERIESGQIGRREPTAPEGGAAKSAMAKEPELPQAGTTRMEDRPPFATGSTIGMSQSVYNKILEMADKRAMEDAAAASKRLQDSERIRQSKEWKENSIAMREEVKAKLLQRPDIAVDELFRKGVLNGRRVKGKIPQLDANVITPAIRKRLPEKYLSKENGIFPDDIAGEFGYQSGNALVERLAMYEDQRKQSGLQGKEYLNKLIDDAIEKAMEEKYGKLKENIDLDIKDQVASDTQLRMIHEEILGVMQHITRAELSITKEQLEEGLQKAFDDTPLSNIKSSSYLRDAGRAGKLAELELITKNNPQGWFAAKQAQYKAVYMAKLAVKLEKDMQKFEKLLDRWSVREDKYIDQEYLDWAHNVMFRIGRPPDMSPIDLANQIAENHPIKTLSEFVLAKEGMGLRELQGVPDWLMDESKSYKFNDLTANEFRQVNNAIQNLIHVGKQEKKAWKAGEEYNLEKTKVEMLLNIRTMAPKIYDAEGERWMAGYIPPKHANVIRNYGYSHLQMETIFNRIDKGNPWGVMTQFMFRDLATSANTERALERTYAKMVRELKDGKFDRNKTVDNPFIMDPESMLRADRGAGEPVPLRLNKVNIRSIILNMGNASNREKFLRGYRVPEANWAAFDSWLTSVSDKEDWAWAQRYGDIFQHFKDNHADPLYVRLNGIAPEPVDIQPFTNAHGEHKGWYYPVIYHSLYEGTSKKLMGGDALEGEQYTRATTPNGYIERRTGYNAPIDLGLDRGVTRLKQQIHDVAFREAIISASKFYYDKEIRSAISHHYGKEATDLLIPYLKDVANSANVRNELAIINGGFSEALRQNLISVLIGWNPATVAKHGLTALYQSGHEVGWKELGDAYASLFSKDDKTGESNWDFAFRMSEELQGRKRHYMEVMRGGSENLFKEWTLRDMMIHSGSFFVAKSDLFSAVPAWLAAYKKGLAETGEIGDAVFLADRAVRRAHGSTAITSRSKIVREGNLWFTSLYGFFNHIMNRQYEIAWKAADALDNRNGRMLPGEDKSIRLERQPDGSYEPKKFKSGSAAVPGLAASLVAYLIVPAVIEEIVSPLPADEEEDSSAIAAKALIKTASSSWIIGRDIAQAALTGKDPSAGLVSTGFKQFTDLYRDMAKEDSFGEDNAGATIQHSINLFGALTGYTNGEMGRRARMMQEMMVDKEKMPEDIKEWFNVLLHSTPEYPRRR